MKPKVIITVLLALVACALVASDGTANAAFPSQESGAQVQVQVEQPGLQPQGGTTGPLSPVGSGFTYQGQLKDGSEPANGQYDFIFTLYDTVEGGTQVGSPVNIDDQSVTEGLFTVQLAFGGSAFAGEARWLEIAVRPAGGGTYTTLSPRQPLTAVPYAMSLVTGSNGAVISGTVQGPALVVTNTASNGIALQATNNSHQSVGVLGQSSGNSSFGVKGTSSSYVGVGGYTTNGVAGVIGQDQAGGYGVYGVSNSGYGVRGLSSSSYGVYGSSTNNSAIYGTSTNVIGVQGIAGSSIYPGVRGENTGSGPGVEGWSANGKGVYGTGTTGVHALGGTWGVYAVGTGLDAYAVAGFAHNGAGATGVYGSSNTGTGVRGYSTSGSGIGVSGINVTNTGWAMSGINDTNSGFARGVVAGSDYGYAFYGRSTNGWAGWFDGNVNVTGTCCAPGEATTKIDHPLDPANKYLNQALVESPDFKTVYDGNVTTDARGEATVALPDYIDALNGDFRYQLTPISQFAQAIVSEEIRDNRFTIKTDKPNVKVSWQVTGIRKDPYASAHPIEVEADKPTEEKGKYRHPEEWGQPDNKGIGYEDRQRVGNEFVKSQEESKVQEQKP